MAKPPSCPSLALLVAAAYPALGRHLLRVTPDERPGDRLAAEDAEAWTDLSDGAAYEAELLFESFYLRDLLSSLRALTPSGLRARGRRELLLAAADLTVRERGTLLAAARQPAKPGSLTDLDPKAQRRFARALRRLAEEIETDASKP